MEMTLQNQFKVMFFKQFEKLHRTDSKKDNLCNSYFICVLNVVKRRGAGAGCWVVSSNFEVPLFRNQKVPV